MGPIYGVRAVLDGDQARILNQAGGFFSRGFEGHDAVGVAMNHEGRYVDARHVLAEVLIPRGHAGEAGCSRGACGHVPTGLHGSLTDGLSHVNIGIKEVLEELGKERITVRGDGSLNPLEHAAINAIRVVAGFQQLWRNAADNHRLAHTFLHVLPDVARHFAAAHRKAD